MSEDSRAPDESLAARAREPDDRAQRSSWAPALRYAVFQIPELLVVGVALAAAHEWLELPLGWAAVVVALWIVKDFVVYPFVRSAYLDDEAAPLRDPRDAIGHAPDGLEGEAYVRIGAERWRARRAPGSPPIAPGESVRVVELEGLTVVVERHEVIRPGDETRG